MKERFGADINLIRRAMNEFNWERAFFNLSVFFQLVKNYRPISVLRICSKIFERILYNSLFTFLNQNDLISPAQSGFKPDYSCINQLLSITLEICHSMDESYEIRCVFLDIPKAFDKV